MNLINLNCNFTKFLLDNMKISLISKNARIITNEVSIDQITNINIKIKNNSIMDDVKIGNCINTNKNNKIPTIKLIFKLLVNRFLIFFNILRFQTYF